MKRAKLKKVLVDGGIVERKDFLSLCHDGETRRGNRAVTPEIEVFDGFEFQLGETNCRVVSECGGGRLQVIVVDSKKSIRGPVRLHSALHKCLTEYTKKIYNKVCQHPLSGLRSFKHFYHRQDAFYRECENFSICSLSGKVVDLSRFEDIRVVRLIRDPRDLVVSSYFYHKRGAEHWCNYLDPTDMDFLMVNGAVPSGLKIGESLMDHLNSVSLEEGLAAEIEFRRYHFESMRDWQDDPRVMVIKYRDFVGNEAETMRRVFKFYGFPWHDQLLAGHFADKFKAERVSEKAVHIRNPSASQWKKYFTDEVSLMFSDKYQDILDRYGF